MNDRREVGKRLRTTDDRGRAVGMVDPYRLYLLRRRDPIPPDVLAEIAGDLGSGLTRVARFLFVAGLLLALPGIVAVVVHGIRIAVAQRMIWPLPAWVMLANFWVVPFVLWLAACEVRRKRVRAVLLKHRRCPHCGYDLRLLPVDPGDNATVCPECGCAWLLEGSRRA